MLVQNLDVYEINFVLIERNVSRMDVFGLMDGDVLKQGQKSITFRKITRSVKRRNMEDVIGSGRKRILSTFISRICMRS